ncbi:LacI family DNA-binding transcriptional regulator [Mycobacterium tuberculosis]|nr:LacI family DNA-binding transcriptional regulator [Mycobacterium tuberculosis]
MSDKKWIKAEDVARLAGVSRSAVSRTFTPAPRCRRRPGRRC